MKYISVREYIDTNFTGKDKPTPRTIRNWIDKGELAGKKIGGKIWVELSLVSTGNPLADKVLNI